MKWNPGGSVPVPGLYDAGDMVKTDGCAQAAALGAQIWRSRPYAEGLRFLYLTSPGIGRMITF